MSPLPVKNFRFFTYTRHSLLLSSEGSLACHIFFDNGHLRGPVALTPVVERLTVDLWLYLL